MTDKGRSHVHIYIHVHVLCVHILLACVSQRSSQSRRKKRANEPANEASCEGNGEERRKRNACPKARLFEVYCSCLRPPFRNNYSKLATLRSLCEEGMGFSLIFCHCNIPDCAVVKTF